MCLYTQTNKTKTANKNIPCYKRGYVEGNEFTPFWGYNLGFTYIRGLTHYTEMKYELIPRYRIYEWKEGFHSSINPESGWFDELFVIPEGANYIEGTNNSDTAICNDFLPHQVVSDNIIWVGNIYNPFTWIKYFFKYYLTNFI